jgi:anti-sigma regulatory factor (Ser/Thr protein kinase)
MEIRKFLISNVARFPRGIVSKAAEHFGVTRQAVQRHMRELVKEGLIAKDGSRSKTTYKLVTVRHATERFTLKGLQEDLVYSEWLIPKIAHLLNANARQIWSYGFTEMLNNAIDHSESEFVLLVCDANAHAVEVLIIDFGIGIFNKISSNFNLGGELQAVHELMKGKLTTDPTRHSGEGIFFTSKMMSKFAVSSGSLYFSRDANSSWVIDSTSGKDRKGTMFSLNQTNESEIHPKDIYSQFTNEDSAFSKTNIQVGMYLHGNNELVSRSQAKRLMNRVELFQTVMLDFEGVESIGQAFADEVFLVYANSHPETNIIPVNAGPGVNSMIQRAKAIDANALK